jgi:hypothetical protein
MAKSTSFTFSNSTATTSKSVPLFDMNEPVNYAWEKTESDNARGTNSTSVGALSSNSEIIEIKAQKFNNVNMPLKLDYPKKGIGAVQYCSCLSTFVRTTDSADPDFIQDDPIFVQITVRHSRSPYITESHVGTAIGRAVSAMQHADGDWRFNDLAKGNVTPHTA